MLVKETFFLQSIWKMFPFSREILAEVKRGSSERSLPKSNLKTGEFRFFLNLVRRQWVLLLFLLKLSFRIAFCQIKDTIFHFRRKTGSSPQCNGKYCLHLCYLAANWEIKVSLKPSLLTEFYAMFLYRVFICNFEITIYFYWNPKIQRYY